MNPPPAPIGPLASVRRPSLHPPPPAKEWSFRLSRPHYRTFGPALRVEDLVASASSAPEGTMVLARPPFEDPEALLRVLDWIQEMVPWAPLAIDAHGRQEVALGALEALFVRCTRRGAVVVVEGRREASDVAALIRDSSDPGPEMVLALDRMLPLWDVEARFAAAVELRRGLDAVQSPDEALSPESGASRRLLFRVGRALGAAILVQREGQRNSQLRLAVRAGFGSDRSLDASLRSLFGRRTVEILGTVGWRWLLWRFFAGAGEGKRRRWW